jgi:hypothetical protein
MKRFLPVAACLISLALHAPAQAQVVELRGRGDVDHDVFLRNLVQAGRYTLISRDTLIARGDTVPGPALVAGATLRMEGVITGDLVIVDANVFLRPTARVLGNVRNVAGGFYPSEQAQVTGSVVAAPNAAYRVVRREGVVVITGTTRRSDLVLHGFRGVLVPKYHRVDALTAGLGAGLLLPRVGLIEPEIRGRVEYRTQRGEFGGGLELAAVRRGTEVGVGAERTTTTNERWIRSDLVNSANALLQAKDRRDYFEVDRAWAGLRRNLETGERTTTAFLRAQVEDARALPARSPWSLFGSFREDNMVFEDSRISSVLAGLALVWTQPTHVLELDVTAEAAGRVLDSEHSFNAYVVDTDWAMAALANHTLRVETHFQGPLPGTDRLPGQRWSFVGGSGTLHTFEDAEFRGDRIALVRTAYAVPFHPRFRMRFVGLPHIELLHVAGMGWTFDERRGFEQNIGVRLVTTFATLRVVTHPDRFTDDIKVSFGLRLPRRPYPWQDDS